MKFLIISHANHKQNGVSISAYAPYVREMNLWLKHVDSVEIVAPKVQTELTAIDLRYLHNSIKLSTIPAIKFTSLGSAIISLFKLPVIFFTLFMACRRADHIHLRCPGNIGLLGCLVQVFFPGKIKTAKYAGNWDPKAKQPLSYRFQKKILSNTFFTKRMSVLVYGAWKAQTKNIKSFFTATFYKKEIEPFNERNYDDCLNFVFVGSLVIGKRPLLAIQIVEDLLKTGRKVTLDIYGDGVLREELELYINENGLKNCITLHGNQVKDIIKEVLKKTHFLILPSKSEGWPKVVAEAMFYGAIPIVTKISCVPYMLDNGKRGVLIPPVKENAVKLIEHYINNEVLSRISENASNWSQQYTLDVFESEIIKLLRH